jgi:steroid 5-alpha reductase family enzyme
MATDSFFANLGWPVLSVLLLNTFVGIIAQIRRDNGLADIAWGLLFLVSGLTGVASFDNFDGVLASPRAMMILLVTAIWGFRLTFYIGSRHNGVEDFRYAKLRKRWEAGGTVNYYVRAFLVVFVMQALISVVVNLPALYVYAYAGAGDSLTPLDYFGLAVWLVGFVMEMTADRQMNQFRQNPDNKGKIMKQGQWVIV